MLQYYLLIPMPDTLGITYCNLVDIVYIFYIFIIKYPVFFQCGIHRLQIGAILVAYFMRVYSKRLYQGVRDTTIGAERYLETHSAPFSLMRALRTTLDALRYVKSECELTALYLMEAVVMFARSIATLYFLPLLSQSLLVSDRMLGWIPIITTTASFATTYLIIPRLGSHRQTSMLGTAFTFLFIGALGISLASTSTVLPLALLYILMGGFANACVGTILQVRIHALIRDDIRSGVMSAFQLLSMLITMPTGVLGGFLYANRPSLTFLLAACAFLSVVASYWYLVKKGWFDWSKAHIR
ncbi:hypothetical protein AGMMS49992_08770 [Clostridia bacterium]|nr:hypothetical protein AGMMS49992_08770 [Clostridia bacterium]